MGAIAEEANRLRSWAIEDSSVTTPPAVADRLDRSDPSTIEILLGALAEPASIEAVEQIEVVAKALWADVLRAGSSASTEDALACGDFFARLGFLHKYKPYGLKLASPFGYTVFDLEPGAGFSFQIHVEPKLESFHIIGTKSSALAYLSSVEEWERAGRRWAEDHFGGGAPDDVDYVWRPDPGDVIRIETTEIVHTVLGCVLEEYASCSVDAVERLLDQNERSELQLPATNRAPADILRDSYQGLPRRLLRRDPSGWVVDPFGETDQIVAVPGELQGGRVSLGPGAVVPAIEDMVTLVIASCGDLEVEIAGRTQAVPFGSVAVALPGLDVTLRGRGDTEVASVHQVNTDSVLADWTR